MSACYIASLSCLNAKLVKYFCVLELPLFGKMTDTDLEDCDFSS